MLNTDFKVLPTTTSLIISKDMNYQFALIDRFLISDKMVLLEKLAQEANTPKISVNLDILTRLLELTNVIKEIPHPI